ncbi:tRNA pseudouridine(55) synthase TruB [Domibacillus enclensis]|uniref:tRNA pseudouridine synthase B n=1 Tax=Domibacillus enclensis TaxID=1017273 RepID=A0A1N6UQ60_9BACI|nr:tRNA pseudouridine(55) synthase TruB [Domibacillus enclensis]OXS78592.1 tRNA pseudouridine(55) synthase [Domibacillus enclensis]SIQ67785.1 tRNA pseudouridine synthase B [Domibacillus enclensis]
MNGILPLWKEKGMTSHDCVFKARKILRTKKVGHTGTLDPDVEGVLPLCIGHATRLAEYITDSGKTYVAEVAIGTSTETEDASGAVLDQKKVEKPISETSLQDVLNSLIGDIEQTPPMYSAVKVNGRRLYEYARAGETVERPSRIVSIYQLEQISEMEYKNGEVRFSIRVVCGKGTYIRTLAVMIGEKLGYPAHMSKLVRTESGGFTQKDCVTLGEMADLLPESMLKPVETAISHLPKWHVHDKVAVMIQNGAVLEMPADWPLQAQEAAVFLNGSFLAIYRIHPEKEGKIKPVKVMPQ